MIRENLVKTRDLPVAEKPHINSTLYWRVIEWIVCSWTI